MGYLKIKRPLAEAVPDNALLYFDEALNEYYIITDNIGNILTWGVA
jgi:hypothetical protein